MPVFSTKSGSTFDASFQLIPIPSGVSKVKNDTETWRIYIVCYPNIEPSSGGGAIAKGDPGDLTAFDLDDGKILIDLLDNHPILGKNAHVVLKFQPCITDAGTAEEAYTYQVSKAEYTDSKGEAPELNRLKSMLSGALKQAGRFSRVRQRSHENIAMAKAEGVTFNDFSVVSPDEDRDLTKAKNFVDLVGLHQDVRKMDFQSCAKPFINVPDEVEPLSWASAREAMAGRFRMPVSKDASSCGLAPTLSKSEAEKYKWMLIQNAEQDIQPNSILRDQFQDENILAPDDFIFAALQTTEVAKKFGLIVEIPMTVPADKFNDDVSGILTLETGEGSVFSTAMTRKFLNRDKTFVVQPKSRFEDRDLTVMTCMLRSDSPQNFASGEIHTNMEYCLQSFSVDHSIIRNILLPAEKNEDHRPYQKYSLTNDSRGVNPPTGMGVTILGPIRDLVSDPGFPAERCEVPPGNYGKILFLEDMWDGYRLDVARITSSGVNIKAAGKEIETGTGTSTRRYLSDAPAKSGDGTQFYSIHNQSLELTYKDENDIDKTEIFTLTEDYIYRDQRTAFNKPPGVCKSEIEEKGEPRVHPALFTWDGTSTIQQVPWACESARRPYESVGWKRGYARVNGKLLTRCPTLTYGSQYEFRLRSVFQGGVGLNQTEADMVMTALRSNGSLDTILGNRISIGHTHTRNRPFPAGVLIFPKNDGLPEGDKGTDQKLRIGNTLKKIDVWLYQRLGSDHSNTLKNQ